MAISLYFDVHVDRAIADQLRLRLVDVLTAQEDRSGALTDDLLLERASQMSRPLVTHDIRLQAMAADWVAQDRPFYGLIFGHLLQVTIGQCVRDLKIIAKATDLADWNSTMIRLPL